ncbi:hypothetical protein ACFP3I_14465 [Chryseobacterium arachidis]|uniref:hypothetical protein n=1 Tax=Chryseobacterium arachidis TaxID=1416778 RepID=UPI00361A4D18
MQLFLYKPSVTSSAERSGVYREVFVEKTNFVLGFKGSQCIPISLGHSNRRIEYQNISKSTTFYL